MTLVDAIARYSRAFDIPSQVVYAISKVESADNMAALRYEYHYRWMWDCRRNKPFRRVSSSEAANANGPADFPGPIAFYASSDTEWHCQRMSWGPFQMMGAVLRENGYTGPFPDICNDPALAAKWACRHLSKLRDRYHSKHGWAGVVAAYNAGRPRKDSSGRYVNQDYVNKVARAGASKYVPIA